MSNDLKNGISMQIYRLEAEIKSLREQRKQQEEVIRELILIVEFYHDERIRYTEMPYKNWNAIIEKAKSLTTKDK